MHLKYRHIDLYRESGSSRMLQITREVFYLGKLYTKTLCKDVGHYSTCTLYDFSIGTLVWKVSQILCLVAIHSRYNRDHVYHCKKKSFSVVIVVNFTFRFVHYLHSYSKEKRLIFLVTLGQGQTFFINGLANYFSLVH